MEKAVDHGSPMIARHRRFGRRLTALVTLVVIGLASLLGPGHARAQDSEPRVQRLTGSVGTGSAVFYSVPGLQEGDLLTVYAEATAGDLDPLIAVLHAEDIATSFGDELLAEVARLITEGEDRVTALTQVANEKTLAWNDDAGSSSNAALSYEIPTTGDYGVMIIGSPFQRTLGDYRLLVGLNAPRVVDGTAAPTGEPFAFFELAYPPQSAAFSTVQGSLSEDQPALLYTLRKLDAGDTVSLRARATSGDLIPSLTLQNFRLKPLATANLDGASAEAQLEYTFQEAAENVSVFVSACCADAPTSGDFELLAGINAPDLTGGDATATTQPAIISPIVVQAGIKMDQITGVDQVAENFGVVADIEIIWQDPALAFNPDECQCAFQTFTQSEFLNYVAGKDAGLWPQTVVHNQQGRRDSQGVTFIVFPSGQVLSTDRSSITLQAPDFDFRLFPFDEQVFYIRLLSSFGESFFVFEELPGYSDIGAQLGEEEWTLNAYETFVDFYEGNSRFNFEFTATRHIEYYLYRVFLPLLIIIIVSWVIFFLKDYQKRVDAAAANLLLLIAFNFTISGNLPRLGYLTFMDAILITAFVVTGSVLILNVFLKRMEVSGREQTAARWDAFVITYYPIAYLLFTGLVFVYFFQEPVLEWVNQFTAGLGV